ncbi:isoprenyl transferase [Salaquimonas pukyongi]|uniref:isoprenyl transferase n=1 Tax=Salaquimonas pukyongi TaxID=2712698 RepID=UPI00096B78B5
MRGTQSQQAGSALQQPPRHLAIIMDGNGRWARKRGLPRHHGHRKGVEAVRTIVKAARELGIAYLTLYSFSTENWSRPRDEINELFKLLRIFIRRDLAELHQNNVQIRVIGERQNVPDDILSLLDEAENLTCNNTAQTLIIAFNYGARQEIVQAVRDIAAQVKRGELDVEAIDETLLDSSLFTAGIPDPDLILRTAGEKRLSNFLLWQSSYSEFVFVDKEWPDMNAEDLAAALEEFAARQRKYGGLAEGSGEETAVRN